VGLGLAASGVLGMSSCNMSVQEICARRLPAFELDVGGALLALRPDLGNAKGASRGIASEFHGADVALTDAERDFWSQWAEQRLTETQHYMDVVEGHSRLLPMRHELSEIATSLVAFHGYARQGKTDRMSRMLERVRSHADKSRALACAAGGGAASGSGSGKAGVGAGAVADVGTKAVASRAANQ
jgi:hypothetical protein